MQKKSQRKTAGGGKGGEGVKKAQTTIRLPKELKEQFQREADEKGMPMKDLLLFILHDYFENIVPE